VLRRICLHKWLYLAIICELNGSEKYAQQSPKALVVQEHACAAVTP